MSTCRPHPRLHARAGPGTGDQEGTPILAEITIQNFAIVDRQRIVWGAGFNVLSGETGAGKSIIIDAVGAMLGGRVGTEVVRAGAERAQVEGVFLLDPAGCAPGTPLGDLLAELGIEAEDGQLILSREIVRASGRTIGRVNGRALPVSVLQQIGERLVDIHGQSEHLSLLRVREHLDYLDRFGGLLSQRAEVGRRVAELRAIQQELRALREDERQAAREVDLLRFQIEEIDRAALRPGEEEELARQRQRLRNVERLRALAQLAYVALQGDDSEPGALDRVNVALAAAADLGRLDPGLAGEEERLNGALAQLEESAAALRHYLESLEADPEALAAVEDRLHLLRDLRRKYGESIADVLRYREEAARRLARIEHREERVAELEAAEAAALAQVGRVAAALSEARRAAAARVEGAVERELADLNMRGTRFVVSIEQQESPQGAPHPDGRWLAFDATGFDRVEFLIAPNPGEPPRPLQRIASGGEMARLSLALKTILSAADATPTLIFDEVDVGVGGRSGHVIGEKLAALARRHQVLCVTHLPQVAAYADHHFTVAKESAGQHIRTSVRQLEGEERVAELAAMLAGSGAGAAALASARELLERSEAWKRGQAPLAAPSAPH